MTGRIFGFGLSHAEFASRHTYRYAAVVVCEDDDVHDVSFLVYEDCHVCINNINALGQHALDLDLDRTAILNTFTPIVPSTDNILVCCQNEKSLLWAGMATSHVWVKSVVQNLPREKITIRLHPRFRTIVDLPGYNIIKPNYTSEDDTDFREVVKNFGTVINYNSGSGIEAKMLGLNVRADKSSLANLSPDLIARTEWFESEIPRVWQHLRAKLC